MLYEDPTAFLEFFGRVLAVTVVAQKRVYGLFGQSRGGNVHRISTSEPSLLLARDALTYRRHE